MNLDSANGWLTLIANIGVIAGIVFLALELRQNNDLMGAQDRFNRLTAATLNGTDVIQSPELIIALNKPLSEQTPEDETLLSYHLNNVFLVWEWSFRELPRDEIPTSLWSTKFCNEITQNVWSRMKSGYSVPFINFVESDVSAYCD